MTNDIELIEASWPAPASVRALTTTRTGGASRGPYASLNLGDHVGDEPEAVRQNRAHLRESLALPTEPVWLKQVHGVRVLDAAATPAGTEADGAWTGRAGVVCAVLTADCLPVFVCDRNGTKVALLHAGWRGLAGGIIESGLRAMNLPPEELLVWLGPAIGPDSYEVGNDVCQSFMTDDPGADEAFRPAGAGRWLADMYRLARRQLRQQGVCAVYGGDHCTLRERDRFYSFRRDSTTGRMASLIWLAS